MIKSTIHDPQKSGESASILLAEPATLFCSVRSQGQSLPCSNVPLAQTYVYGQD